jgi:sugar phosphate permease
VKSCGTAGDRDTLGAVSDPPRKDASDDDRVYAPPGGGEAERGADLAAGEPPGEAGSQHSEGALDPRRWRVFGLTWLSYASYYLTRKNFAIAKDTLYDTYGFSTKQLGSIDASYGAAYALGQFVWGATADRYGPRRVIGFGMLATAACSLAFGMQTTFWGMMVLFTLNGFVQATGWSPNVKAMTGWFPDKKRGAIMGFWTTNYSVGSFVAGPVASFFISPPAWAPSFLEGLGWQWAFFGPAIPVALVGLVLLFFLPELRVHREDTAEKQRAADGQKMADRRAARGVVLRTPFLWSLGLAYFFLKLVRYFFLNWSKFYMVKVLHYEGSTATNVSLMFEGGGILGAIAIGWVSDRFMKGRRVPVAVVSIALLSVALAMYGGAASSGMGWNIAVLGLCGFFLYGPDAMVSATAAQDVGGQRAAAIAAGFINGLGSLGQVVAGPLAPSDMGGANWTTVFRLLGCGTAISALVLLPFWNRGRAAAEVGTRAS